MDISIRKEGTLIEGFKPEYHWCKGHRGSCPGPEPPGPEPPGPDTGDTGITWIKILVADSITDKGVAGFEFSPSSAETSVFYTSSDPETASIHPYTGKITVESDGVVTFCVTDILTGLQDCKEVDVYKSEPGPEPPVTGDTGITSIEIIVADTITDEGIATYRFEPVTADTSIVFSSSDPDYAIIDEDTGEIEVYDTGFVTFCVEDLLTQLKDCKTVYVIKSIEPGPDTGDTGSTDYRLKVVYNRNTTSTRKLLSNASGITTAEFEDGTIIQNPGNNFVYNFGSDGLHTVYYTLSSSELNDHLFSQVFEIEEVEIPSGVTRIGDWCFSNAFGGAMRIEFPDTLEEIGDYAFFRNNGNFEGGVVLPEGLKTIGEHCFEESRYLQYLSIPSTVESIGDFVCHQCSRLQTVNILCNIDVFEKNDQNNFAECPSLVSFYGPNASGDHRMLITDDNIAVSFAPAGLASYTTPNGIERIGSFCFETDEYTDLFPTQIEVLTISEGVKYIDELAFHCHNLALRRVNLPSTLLEMNGDEVFDGRSNLSDIYCYATTAPLVGNRTFYHKNQDYFPYNGKLHYPAGSNYSSWLSGNAYYLGYYGWTGQEINDI